MGKIRSKRRTYRKTKTHRKKYVRSKRVKRSSKKTRKSKKRKSLRGGMRPTRHRMRRELEAMKQIELKNDPAKQEKVARKARKKQEKATRKATREAEKRQEKQWRKETREQVSKKKRTGKEDKKKKELEITTRDMGDMEYHSPLYRGSKSSESEEGSSSDPRESSPPGEDSPDTPGKRVSFVSDVTFENPLAIESQ